MNTKQKRMTIMVVLLLLLVGGLVGYRLLHKDNGLIFDSSAKKYDAKIKKPQDWTNTRIAFPGYKDTKIMEGDKALYIALSNPSFNEANFKFKVYIDHEDKEHELLDSDLVKPGEAITQVSLPKDLTAGEHMVFLRIKPFPPHDKTAKLNDYKTSFKLMVLKPEEKG